MATIGGFTKTHDGSYTGAIRTLSLTHVLRIGMEWSWP